VSKIKSIIAECFVEIKGSFSARYGGHESLSWVCERHVRRPEAQGRHFEPFVWNLRSVRGGEATKVDMASEIWEGEERGL
jgi:hypothetical protein